MTTYLVCMTVTDAEDRRNWWDGNVIAQQVTAADPFEALLQAVADENNKGIPEGSLHRWSKERAFLELFGDDGVSYSARVFALVNPAAIEVEPISLFTRRKRLNDARATLRVAINAIDTTLKPAAEILLTDEASQMVQGLLTLKAEYERDLAKLTAQKEALDQQEQAWFDTGRSDRDRSRTVAKEEAALAKKSPRSTKKD